VYNTSINKNLLSWKKYNFSDVWLNERNQYEIKFDTSDSVMMGTHHSFEDTGYVTTRY